MSIFRYGDLLEFSSEILMKAGMPAAMARAVSSVFVEADLLGFSTHGVRRLSSNVSWIEKGETRTDAQIEVVKETPVASLWDGHFLPGPWVVQKALEFASERATVSGVSVVSIRKVQHIACLAAYLERITAKGLVPLIIASTPGERSVSAFGGLSRVFSPNPVALGVPTSTQPILFDTTMSMVAEGKVKQALVEKNPLPLHAIKSAVGDPSDNPEDYWQQPMGSLMPIGGVDHGFKGTSLLIMTEVLTMALSGHGRLDGSDDGEANSVFVQVFDPDLFGGRARFIDEADNLVKSMHSSRVYSGSPNVRVPGERALRMKAHQLSSGIALRDSVLEDLRALADRYRHNFPEAVSQPQVC